MAVTVREGPRGPRFSADLPAHNRTATMGDPDKWRAARNRSSGKAFWARFSVPPAADALVLSTSEAYESVLLTGACPFSRLGVQVRPASRF